MKDGRRRAYDLTDDRLLGIAQRYCTELMPWFVV